jgi:CheY-like chemotaxis protein
MVLPAALAVAMLAAAAPTPRPVEARLLVTSGVNGDLAHPACSAGGLLPSSFGALSEAVRANGSVAVDTGGLLSFSGVARFAAEHEPEALAKLVKETGYRALFVGLADLAMPRKDVVEVWRRLRAHAVPAIATNLRCDESAKEVCEAVAPSAVIDGMALVSVLPEDALTRVGREEAKGLSLEPPALAIARATRDARSRGATIVVASIDDRPAGAAAGKALELAASLPPDGRPDLLLSARAGAQLLFARPPGVKPALAAAPPGGAIDIVVRPTQAVAGADGERAKADADITVRPLPRAASPSQASQRFLAEVGPSFCAAFARPLRQGHLEHPIDGEGLLRLAAAAARAAARAEVAIVNRAAVDPRFAPANPAELAASDVYAALPYDEPIEVAEVGGEWLSARAKDPNLLVLGAEEKTVNGRPLEPSATYRVATIRFLAEGGDAALPRGPRWTELRHAALRTTLLDALDSPASIPDPAGAVEWTLRPDLDARFASSTISNPALYSAAPLQRTNTLTGGFEANGRLTADAPAWLWENAALWRYTSTKTSAPASVTHDDLESLRSTLTERVFSKATLPQPYLEGYVETEAASVDGAGTRRWLGRGSLGFREAPHPKLVLKLAGAVERQVGDGAPRTLFGANAQLTLAPWELYKAGSRRVQADATVDAFIGGETTQTTVRAHAGLTLDLIGPLSLVLAADLYAERDGAGPFGAALDTSAGLKLRTVERTSSF